MASGDEDKVLRQLVQNLRNDLSLLSNEAKKKYPAVKEVRLPTDYSKMFAYHHSTRKGIFYVTPLGSRTRSYEAEVGIGSPWFYTRGLAPCLRARTVFV